jgi:hypothetical protein
MNKIVNIFFISIIVSAFICSGFVTRSHYSNAHVSIRDTVPKSNAPMQVVQQQPNDSSTYVLIGTLNHFRVLMRVLNTPEPSHKDVLLIQDWIQNNVRSLTIGTKDSTNKK